MPTLAFEPVFKVIPGALETTIKLLIFCPPDIFLITRLFATPELAYPIPY